MNYTITINASTPEELSAIISKLQVSEPVQHPSIQNQPTYQQHQAIQQTAPIQPAAVTPVSVYPPQQAGPSVTYQPAVPVVQPAQQQTAIPASVPTTSAVPTTEPVYTLEQLAVAATPLNDSGRGPELTALLNQFGVQSLTQLPKEQYGNFATALRQMGAKI